jgi:hypothetical protein
MVSGGRCHITESGVDSLAYRDLIWHESGTSPLLDDQNYPLTCYDGAANHYPLKVETPIIHSFVPARRSAQTTSSEDRGRRF